MGEKKYIQILEENLTSQIDLLRRLSILSQEQTKILNDVNAKPVTFEENLKEREKLIGRLSSMDQGLEKVLGQVKKELAAAGDENEAVIARIQKLLKEVDARAASLQAVEKQNKDLAGDKFSQIRAKTKELRQHTKASNVYHQSMMKLGVIEPQFMDRKK